MNKSFTGKNVVEEFGERINNAEDDEIYRIAKWLGEEDIRFLIFCKKDVNCGMPGIQWAYDMTKEQDSKGSVDNKGKLFNFLIKEFKKKKIGN